MNRPALSPPALPRWRPAGLALGALAALILGAGCGDEPNDGHCDLYGGLESSTIELRAPFDAPTRLVLETCRLDADTCDSLCDSLMEQRQLFGQRLECSVSFREELVKVEVLHVDISDCESDGDVPLPFPEPNVNAAPR